MLLCITDGSVQLVIQCSLSYQSYTFCKFELNGRKVCLFVLLAIISFCSPVPICVLYFHSGGEKSTRMITLGDHIDAIIINDYHSRTSTTKEGEALGKTSLLSQINSTSTPASGQDTPSTPPPSPPAGDSFLSPPPPQYPLSQSVIIGTIKECSMFP